MIRQYQLLVLGAFMALCGTVSAAILTVDPNGNAAGGTYSTVQSAVTAANSGDTIYLKASAFYFNSGAQISKRLIFIGEGYSTNAAQDRYAIMFGTNLNAGADSSEFYGVYLSATLNTSMSNLVFERCDVSLAFNSFTPHTYTNIAVRNCIVQGIQATSFSVMTFQNFLMTNCIIPPGAVIYMNSTAGSTILFSNNVVVRSSANFQVNSTLSNVVFTNNIVIYNSGSNISTFPDNNNSISNNIFYNSGTGALPNPVSGTNSGGGNLFTQPTFAGGSFPLSSGWTTTNFLSFTDFELASGSVGKNAGTDNTDIGIFGGSHPWPVGFDFASGRKYLLMPSIPFIQSVNVQNASVPQNGNLNVEIKARKAY